jgi:hypothetical protein
MGPKQVDTMLRCEMEGVWFGMSAHTPVAYRIDPNGGFSRSLEKLMHNKKLGR